MIVEKSIEHLNNSNVRLTLHVASDILQKEYGVILKDYAKKIHIKGFRVGKVPYTVLEQKYGDRIKIEATQKIIDNAMREALSSIDPSVRPLGIAQPVLEDDFSFTTISLDEDIKFSLIYDIYPHIETLEYTNLEIDGVTVTVDDDDIAFELGQIQEQNAVVTDKADDAPIVIGDLVTLKFYEVDDADGVVQGTERSGFSFVVGSKENIYELDEVIVGMKVRDNKIVERTYADDYHFSEIAGRSLRIYIEIETVRQRNLPEIDDELAQDVSSQYETLEDLKQAVSQRLFEKAQAYEREKQMAALIDTISKQVDIVLPESMISMQLQHSWQRFCQQFGGDEKMVEHMLHAEGQSHSALIESWKPAVQVNLVRELIVQKLVELEQIKIDDDAINTEIEKRIAEHSAQEQQAREYFSSEQARNNIFLYLQEQKLYTILLENCTINETVSQAVRDLR